MNIHVQCPHCKNPIELLDIQPRQEVSCAACGSSFQLENLTTADWTPSGKSVGRFEIVEEIGRGGFGTVYRAHDPRLDRIVALKVPRRSNIGDDPLDLERFLREARSVAQLRHPFIVSVHEVGAQDDMPYLVSDYIAGITLADLLTARRPAPREAARLIADVAEALHYAHQQGVVHRDVKPSNIMLEPIAPGSASGPDADSGAGPGARTPWLEAATELSRYAPKLLDFGLAKRDAGEITMTMNGEVLGTPAYMSPEQARGEAHKVDGRSDIYSLGVILYQLLTGELPFRGNKRMLLHQVLHDEPRPPRNLNDRIPRDLETITLKAMAKEPARRFDTAQALAADLRRFLRHEPIQARPVGGAERLWRWCRRNPLVAVLTGAVAAALMAGTIIASALAFWALDERDRADREAAHAANNELVAKANESLAKKSEALAKQYAAETRLEVERFQVAHGLRQAHDGDIFPALLWLSKPLDSEHGPSVLEEIHRHRLSNFWRYTSKPVVTQCIFIDGEVNHGTFSPDGTRVLINHNDGTVRVWSIATGQPITPPLPQSKYEDRAAFSPDGRSIVTAGLGGTAQIWDAFTGRPIARTLPLHELRVNHVAFSPDGSRVATASNDKTVRIWEASRGQPVVPALHHQRAVSHVAFSPDGRRVVTITDDGARVWDAVSGQLVTPPIKHLKRIADAVFSADGRLLVTASEDFTARVWNATTGTAMTGLLEHAGIVYRVAFSPEGRRVVSASADMTARVWDAGTGQPLTPPLPHRDELWEASFSPDGRRVVTASDDGTARVWDAASGQPIGPPLRHQGIGTVGVYRASFTPDGRRILTAGFDQSVRVWDMAGKAAKAHATPGGKAAGVEAFSPDGRRVLLRAADKESVHICDAISGQPLTPPLRHKGGVRQAAFSSDGSRIVTAGYDQTARAWDAATGQPLSPPLEHPQLYRALLSPNGSRVATVNFDLTKARVWDATSGKPLTPFLDGRADGTIEPVVFSPDGRRLVTKSSDGSACIRDAATGEQIAPRLKHRYEHYITHAAFSSDGRRVVTSSDNKTARIWDAATGAAVAIPLQHQGAVNRTVFSPDGRRTLSASADYTARVWDAATGLPLTPPLQHQGQVLDAAFSGDGRRVVTAGGDETVRVWDAHTGQPLIPPLVHAKRVVLARFDAAGQRILTLTSDGMPRSWDIALIDRPAKEWVMLGQLFNGKLDRSGGIHLQTREEMEKAWSVLLTKYPSEFTVTADQALAWHRHEAADCLKENNAPAFLFHYFRGHLEWPLIIGWPR